MCMIFTYEKWDEKAAFVHKISLTTHKLSLLIGRRKKKQIEHNEVCANDFKLDIQFAHICESKQKDEIKAKQTI